VDPNDGTTLLLYFDDGPIPPAQIWYGRGKDPYCNIRDSAGMALPAFGPLEVEP
jgi:sialate O-acetylesterase